PGFEVGLRRRGIGVGSSEPAIVGLVDRDGERVWQGAFSASIHPRGLEPLTVGSEDRCSIQLSYGCNIPIARPDLERRATKLKYTVQGVEDKSPREGLTKSSGILYIGILARRLSDRSSGLRSLNR